MFDPPSRDKRRIGIQAYHHSRTHSSQNRNKRSLEHPIDPSFPTQGKIIRLPYNTTTALPGVISSPETVFNFLVLALQTVDSTQAQTSQTNDLSVSYSL